MHSVVSGSVSNIAIMENEHIYSYNYMREERHEVSNPKNTTEKINIESLNLGIHNLEMQNLENISDVWQV